MGSSKKKSSRGRLLPSMIENTDPNRPRVKENGAATIIA